MRSNRTAIISSQSKVTLNGTEFRRIFGSTYDFDERKQKHANDEKKNAEQLPRAESRYRFS